MDPRELISLYPAMPVLSEDFTPQTTVVSNAKDLWTLSRNDWPTFQQYLIFLDNFLREVKPTAQGQTHLQDIDSALFKLYLEQGENEKLDQLVSTQNNCNLQMCVADLEQHKRFALITFTGYFRSLFKKSQTNLLPFQVFHTWIALSKPRPAFQCNSGIERHTEQ